MQDFSSFFFPQSSQFSLYFRIFAAQKAHDNNTYHIGYYGSPVHLGQGEWTNLAHLATDTSNWVVIDQPEKTADKVLLDYKAPVAAAIMLLMMKAGGYTFMDYVKVGLPLQIIIGVVMTFVLPLLFPY